jgi:catechol 2,3-dioxygenase-like lactoylglutathione lyase family enzyme
MDQKNLLDAPRRPSPLFTNTMLGIAAPGTARQKGIARLPKTEKRMIQRFDHVTIVVRDLENAKGFFGLLGFREDMSAVISGETFAHYMGVRGIEAEHVTLVLTEASPRLEVQLLAYRQPVPIPDPNIAKLEKVGFNHVCFAVDDLEAEVARLVAAGVKLRNQVMIFQGRKLVFLEGPEGVTIELAEWGTR